MSQQTKTDNRRLDLKLQLRRRVIEESGLEQLRVLDLCAGAGEIWRSMRQFVKVADYIPVDISPRLPGTLHGDVTDTRFLSGFDISRFTVIDIDTYGEPWKPWRHVLDRMKTTTAVFLTHGTVSSPGGAKISAFAREAMGIPKDWDIPMKRELALFAARYVLGCEGEFVSIQKGYKVTLENVSYYGLICGGKGRTTKNVGHNENKLD